MMWVCDKVFFFFFLKWWFEELCACSLIPGLQLGGDVFNSRDVCRSLVQWVQVECWECTGEERRWALGHKFVFGEQHVAKFWFRWVGCVWPENLKLIYGRVARSAMWILGGKSPFTLQLRKTTGNLIRFGVPDAQWLLTSSPACVYTNQNGSSCVCSFCMHSNIQSWFSKVFFAPLGE